MNERNTNRRAQTRSNRTTQRHQIDGRPAPRRQASHASDYSEGTFTQPSHSSTFRTDPRESGQSARSRLAKEPAPTFAMDTRKNAVTCPFSLVEQQPSLSLFFS